MSVSDEQIKLMEEAVKACEEFFRVTMPKINVGQSPLDAEDIDRWIDAEITVKEAMDTIRKRKE